MLLSLALSWVLVRVNSSNTHPLTLRCFRRRFTGVGAHIVVGTPGKVCDWLKKRSINPTTVKVLVLDEADEMCNESSHRTNSLLIKKAMPPTCQCLFFSATFPKEVLDFAGKLVGQADKILISSDEELVLDVIKQLWIDTGTYQVRLTSSCDWSWGWGCRMLRLI